MDPRKKMEHEAYLEPMIELVVKSQTGDLQAFNQLVLRYQHLVYNFLYRLAPHWDDLDDLAQEVFIKVYASLKNLHEQAHFKSWLYRIAVSVYVDEQRRRQKRERRFIADEQVLNAQTDPDANPGQDLERRELQTCLQEAISQLPEEYRLAIVLREIQELSYEEIAVALKCSSGTVRSRIFRGRQLLQQMLRKHLQPEDI
jgi:RNA polymerase sigma-70 factor, ECF subfamily